MVRIKREDILDVLNFERKEKYNKINNKAFVN
jgi:hypothetical protein